MKLGMVSGRRLSHLSVLLRYGNSPELRCGRKVGWFLSLHVTGSFRQNSVSCMEIALELLCFQLILPGVGRNV